MTTDPHSQYSVSFVIPAAHPSLPGHFPDNPVVPGVVILEQVIDAAENWLGTSIRLRQLPRVKFLAPLFPGDHARISLQVAEAGLEFSVSCENRPIAKGTMQLTQGEVR